MENIVFDLSKSNILPLGRRGEHNARKVTFDGFHRESPDNIVYVMCGAPIERMIPLSTDLSFIVQTNITADKATIPMELLEVDGEGNLVKKSKLFSGIVADALEPSEEIEVTDPSLDLLYAELYKTYVEIKAAYESGAFKGEKGDTGEPGPAGANGRDGRDGRDGKDGKDGKDAEPYDDTEIKEELAKKITIDDIPTPAEVASTTDTEKVIKFGQDPEGNWGYIPDGADTVIPFKSGHKSDWALAGILATGGKESQEIELQSGELLYYICPYTPSAGATPASFKAVYYPSVPKIGRKIVNDTTKGTTYGYGDYSLSQVPHIKRVDDAHVVIVSTQGITFFKVAPAGAEVLLSATVDKLPTLTELVDEFN